MQQSKDQLYELIKDLKTKDEFEKEIKERYKKHNQLFDKDTVALFLIDELGKNNQVINKIADLKPDSNHTISGTVTNIYELRTFTRKNGSSGRVVKLDVNDNTGLCRLVLWDKDVEQVTNKKIKKGTKIKIINGYTKNGYSGLELHLGRWGLLETESNDTLGIREIELDQIKGRLVDKESTRAFFKSTGEFGFVSKIKIKGDKKENIITFWDEKVKEIQKFKIGDILVIKDFTMKKNNGRTELHANGSCSIEKI
jgi:replication factor A1